MEVSVVLVVVTGQYQIRAPVIIGQGGREGGGCGVQLDMVSNVFLLSFFCFSFISYTHLFLCFFCCQVMEFLSGHFLL